MGSLSAETPKTIVLASDRLLLDNAIHRFIRIFTCFFCLRQLALLRRHSRTCPLDLQGFCLITNISDCSFLGSSTTHISKFLLGLRSLVVNGVRL